MNDTNPAARFIADICAASEFRGKGMTFYREGLTAPQFFDRLVDQECYPDAIRFLAHALPKRQAVWWGSLCLWHVYRPAPPAAVADILQAAVRWVQEPMEERRRMMNQHIRIGHEFPGIRINTSYSFGLDDQDFVVSFEGSDPKEFVTLVMRLRESEGSRYTQRDTPIFTCASRPLEEILWSLG